MYEGLIVHYHVSKGKEGCGRLAAAGYKDTGMPAIARPHPSKLLYIKRPRSAPSSEGAERGAFWGQQGKVPCRPKGAAGYLAWWYFDQSTLRISPEAAASWWKAKQQSSA